MPDAARYSAQRLGRVDVAPPGLGVGVDHERVDLQLLRRAYSIGRAQSVPPNGRSADRPHGVVEPLPRADRERRQAVRGTVPARL